MGAESTETVEGDGGRVTIPLVEAFDLQVAAATDREGELIDERWVDSDGVDRLRWVLRHKELPE